MKALAAASGLMALIATVYIMHGLTADQPLPSTPSVGERCLSEGWRVAEGPARKEVIRQCLNLLDSER